ncbi:hypothetical protein BRD00_03535 [Halobacteriales archaeon QS_8_69_26]|nr:MAG: hypothetical protein BRD00_03535 [Halobacteriales archaeon QS_8_69_26]
MSDTPDDFEWDETSPLSDGVEIEDWRSADEDGPDDGPLADDYEIVALFEGPAEEGQSCTLVPREAEEDELMTHWLTADAGSIVSLDEVR